MRRRRESAWAASLNRRVKRHQKVIFFLDYDGTLAPIGKYPDQAFMRPDMVRTIQRLSDQPHARVVVISGRSLQDLKNRFPVKKNVVFSGNHGFEIEGDRIPLPARAQKAREYHRTFRLVVQKLCDTFRFLPGVTVEDKQITVSIHYRNVPREHLPFFRELLEYLKVKYRGYPMVWRPGKKVWQIYPNAFWDKGCMVRHVLKRFPGSFPVVLGDDETDEDMFGAIGQKGITVRVGHPRNSYAQYRLPSQSSVARFLEGFIQPCQAL